MRRKGVPCSCESDSLKCGNKVRKIDGISPDPNGEFTIEAGNGIAINTGENKIVIINNAIASSFVAGDNIEINPSGDDLEIRVKDDISVDNVDVAQDVDVTGDVNVSNDVNIGGDLNIAGDIIQQGSSYETHAEQVYTTKDYIYMREGAVGGLGVGDYSGFEVIKYDGTNDGRLVIDKDGVARVGDVGDEQPLLTREESANITDGALLKWDAVNQKAVDEGTVGDDTHPVKSVNGVLTPVTDPLVKAVETQSVYNLIGGMSGQVSVNKKNGICTITCMGASTTGSITDASITAEAMPIPMGGYVRIPITFSTSVLGNAYIYTGYNLQLHATISGAQSNISFTLTYAIDE